MLAAEQAAGITRDADGNEQVSEETPDAATELADSTPVAASDQPLAAEPEAVEAEDTSEQQEAVAPPAQTVEELQAEIEKLNARLEEKDTFIGRQSSDVGELRKIVDELSARVSAQPVQSAQQAPQVAITQDLIDTNPMYATQLAYEQKNDAALKIALEAWKDEDPFAAASWRSDRLLEARQAEWEAKLAERDKKLEQLAEPVAQNAEQAQWNAAFLEVKKTHPDFIENAERLLEEVAPQYPALAKTLATGDASEKAEALKILYSLDKFGNPEQVRQDLEREASEAAAEAAASRAAAGVVSGQTTVGEQTVDKTDEELEQDRYISRMDNKPSLSRGWTGRG